ncbi:glycerate kinase type-2 family protein [Persephonella sp.]
MNLRQTAVDLFLKGVEAVRPENLIPSKLSLENNQLTVENKTYTIPENIYVFGSGKASIEMAKAVESLLGNRIKDGLIVCNYTEKLKKLKVVKGNHPVPDRDSIKAGELLINGLSALNEDDFFIYLLSGGSSALIEKPIPPITLEDLKKTTQLLLSHSVPIEDINIIRKHISQIKGGRLGQKTKARGVVLVISDVIGDDLFTIGSAPLYYDRSTYRDAFDVLKKYDLIDKIPDSVRQVIIKGLNGEIEETPKKENPRISHHIIGRNMDALKEIQNASPFPAYILTSRLHGEAREVAKAILSIGMEIKNTSNPFSPPAVLLFGGETTVNVKGNGRGGRNQELVLSALIDLKDTPGIVILSGGTDGIDGNSDAAGAVADSQTYRKAIEKGIDLNAYLENNDSYTFFTEVGGVIKTGYTGTNVMDLTIIIIGGKE